ncbi:MarR family transcriptional regulator [Weizmannia coagulans]|uniref:Transcriptional regulator, MarR family n=3 Tax=Heyndrickxia TaxID=2837504 RepID=G2TH94_HEYCO|nr:MULTISPECIES: MarR family transcriptional regulator [Heyndrickxia]AEO99993.1 transcriptional regulator, MarR family [Heyndrickxia coagulans 36D1]AJO24328.1 MarR family transcriptional regulator [Heyndrickxia coagulans]AKN54204.1 Transcriptional regulator, MarR family [Heyndrickxia coagulans]ATW84188.1 MarR family transcriptional regulator [Heyndrickxia coagulans]KGB30474.1 MarR family transcriptional regulator [Heyndrickxia coagulans]
MQGLFYRYIRLYRVLIKKLNGLLAQFGLSYSLWQVMFYVRNFGPCTLVEICKYYQIEKPNVTRIVQKLEEQGSVEQIPGKDRREKVIRVTDKGENIYRQCRAEITGLEQQAMKGIPEAEQKIIFELLPQIRDNLDYKGEETN